RQGPELIHRFASLKTALRDIELVRPIRFALIFMVAPMNTERADQHEVTNRHLNHEESCPPLNVQPRCAPPVFCRLRPSGTDKSVVNDALQKDLIRLAGVAHPKPAMFCDKL